MSNELSESSRIPEPSRPRQPLKSCLQSSLEYRLSHRAEAADGEPEPLVDVPGELSEEILHPGQGGLVCDAPLGLKQ